MVFWLVLGGAFVAGIFAYERVVASCLTSAELDGRRDSSRDSSQCTSLMVDEKDPLPRTPNG